MIRLVFISVLLLIIVATAVAEVNRENLTSRAEYWSSASEEADLINGVAEGEVDLSSGADGGFSSFEGMLQWAIGHSDPSKLKDKAEDVQRMSSSELQKRQMEIKELMEKLKTPSDAQLMKIAIDDLNNSSISLVERHRALQELLILVEPIDNANDLEKLGGWIPIIRELDNPDSEIRSLSAWVIGKASQNNPLVQKQLLEHGALYKLMQMINPSTVEEAIKALYAVSALIRNNEDGQTFFYAKNGVSLLQGIINNATIDLRLCKKAVLLISDLAESNLENHEKTRLPFLDDKQFLKSLVSLLSLTNLDLQEKVLLAIKSLLQLEATDALILRDFCSLDSALDQFRNHLTRVGNQREYAADLETLYKDVESVYLEKINNAVAVS